MKKVFVSGCYDLLHSGHVEFFRQASQYGELYVGIGSDSTILEYKHHKTFYPEQERLFMVKSIRYVKDAFINAGSGNDYIYIEKDHVLRANLGDGADTLQMRARDLMSEDTIVGGNTDGYDTIKLSNVGGDLVSGLVRKSETTHTSQIGRYRMVGTLGGTLQPANSAAASKTKAAFVGVACRVFMAEPPQ